MKYVPMQKGMLKRVALYTKSGEKLELPKGMTARFKMFGNQIFFELLVNGQVVTPALQAIETSGKIWTMHLHDSGCFDMNIETFEHTPVYDREIEQLKISRDGKLILEDSNGKVDETQLSLDKDLLGEKVNDRYLFKTLIGVKNADGKCAILDSETGTYLTNFEFESGKYDIVDALNNVTYVLDYDRIYVIEKQLEDKKKEYLFVAEDGKVITRVNAENHLWTFARDEKFGTKDCRFEYVAFAAKTKEGIEYTKILKINSKTQEVVYETNIRGTVDKEDQFREDFVQLASGEIIMKTSETDPKTKNTLFGAVVLYPDGTAKVIRANENTEITRVITNVGKSVFDDGIVFITKKPDENGEIKSGAVKLTKDHVVEILLENEWNKVEFKKEPNGKYFLDFIGKKKYGRIPLEGSSEGYVSSVASFVSLSTKHFSHILSKPIRPKQDKKKQMSDSTSRTEVSSISKPSLFDLLGNPKQNGEE